MPILERLTGLVFALLDVLLFAVGKITPAPTLVPIPIRTQEAERKAAMAAARRRREYTA